MPERLVMLPQGGYFGHPGASVEDCLREAIELAREEGGISLHLGTIPRAVDLEVQPDADLQDLLNEVHRLRTLKD